jgi:hypothetical protein
MKRLLVILILIFTLQTPSWADDIRDFQIEGMSVGDSLLDYFSEEEINKEKWHAYNYNDVFSTIGFAKSSFEIYDKVQFHYKLKDKNYKIYGLIGVIVFKGNIKDCFNKKDEIVSELSDVLKDTKKKINDKKKHLADKSGKSKTYDVYFNFKSGNYIAVSCYDWSEEMTKKNKWFDNLKVAIQTKEFEDFLTEYYK